MIERVSESSRNFEMLKINTEQMQRNKDQNIKTDESEDSVIISDRGRELSQMSKTTVKVSKAEETPSSEVEVKETDVNALT